MTIYWADFNMLISIFATTLGGLGKRAWNSAFSSGMGKRKWNSGFSGFQKGSLTDKSKSEFEESHIVSDKKKLKNCLEEY